MASPCLMALGQGLVSSELIIKKPTYQSLFIYTIVHLKIYMIVDFSWRQILKAKYNLSLFIYIDVLAIIQNTWTICFSNYLFQQWWNWNMFIGFSLYSVHLGIYWVNPTINCIFLIYLILKLIHVLIHVLMLLIFFEKIQT